jgi:hypothetical protein
MSIEVLKQELAGLGVLERNQIVAYLLALQDEADKGYREALARRIDDQNPANWADLDEFDRRLQVREDPSP